MNQEKFNSENWSENLKIKAGSTVRYDNSYYVSKNGINDAPPSESANFVYSGEIKKDESFPFKDLSNLSSKSVLIWQNKLAIETIEPEYNDIFDN